MSVKQKQNRKLTKAEQSAETRAIFIRVARQLFAEQGYGATSTEQILAQTGVTRGALYYQFADKADLFRAVCEQMQQEIVEQIVLAVKQTNNAWQALLTGCDVVLDMAAQRDVQQILFLDAPSVLGWEEWQRIDAEQGDGLLIFGVQRAIETGYLKPQSAEALAMMINGAINEGVFWATRSSASVERLTAVRETLHQLLEGLRSS
jgi:AcrR family transcriptional regulator